MRVLILLPQIFFGTYVDRFNLKCESVEYYDASSDSSIDARKICTDRGMWAIIDLKWTKQLSKWIGNRTVLEILRTAWRGKPYCSRFCLIKMR